jgi:hypothetical protein
VKVGGIFDSSQGSRKQKPQPDRILTEAKLALAVPIGDTNIQAEARRKSMRVRRARRNVNPIASVIVLVPCFGDVILFRLVQVRWAQRVIPVHRGQRGRAAFTSSKLPSLIQRPALARRGPQSRCACVSES